MKISKFDMLRKIGESPVSVLDLSPYECRLCASLISDGAITIKKSLNTSRLHPTRLGRELICHHESNNVSSGKAWEMIKQEVARVKVRESLEVKHRLNKPKHKQ